MPRFHTQIDLFEALKEPGRKLGTDEAVILQLPLLPQGEFDHPSYGKLNFTPAKFAQMRQHFEDGSIGFVPSLNLDHASQNPFAAECRAMGWFKGLVEVPGVGLDFLVELTPAGAKAIEDKEYRYISAETADLWTVPTGESYANVILGAALTNLPYFSQMRGIFDNKAACFSSKGGASFGATESAPDVEALSASLFRMGDDYSFNEIRAKIRLALDAEVASSGHVMDCYVEEVYPEFFIYELWVYGSETERYLKRGYTLADGEVTLAPADSAIPVEEVWVESARKAMSAARKAARTMGREHRASVREPAAQPARGGLMSIWDKLRQRFGLAESATEAEIEAAVEAEVEQVPAGEVPALGVVEGQPLTPPADFSAMQVQVAALSTRLTAAEADAKAAREGQALSVAALATAKANALIATYQEKGVITPAMLEGAAGLALREMAEKSPEAFEAVWGKVVPTVPLGSFGIIDHGRSGAAPESFEALIASIQEKDKLDFNAAVMRAHEQRPDLYAKYRSGQAGGIH